MKMSSWLRSFLHYPPDGGYAWIVLAAGFVTTVLINATGPLFGILFNHKIKSLEMSSFNVTFAFNCYAVFWSLSLTMSGPLCKEFGWRRIAIAGGFLTSLSLFTTAFASSKLNIYFCFSLIAGFGCGLVFSTAVYIISNYFLQLRGLAMAILGSGIGVGQIILPLFIRYLQKHYGFHGAAIIYSAFILNVVVAAALFHPLEWHERKSNKKTKTDLLENNIERDLTMQIDNRHNTSTSSSFLFSLVQKITNSFIRISRNVLEFSINNVMNLKSPVVAILSITGALIIMCITNMVLMLPLSLQSKGLTLQHAAYLMSIAGFSSMFSRIFIPALSDFKGVNTTACYIASEVLIGIACIGYTFARDFSYIALCFGIYGLGSGAAVGIYPIILIEYRGLDELPDNYGSFGFVSSIFFILIGPSFGYIRDITGSYLLMYRTIFGVIMLAVSIWCLMPYAVKYEKKKQQSLEVTSKHSNGNQEASLEAVKLYAFPNENST